MAIPFISFVSDWPCSRTLECRANLILGAAFITFVKHDMSCIKTVMHSMINNIIDAAVLHERIK